MRKILQEGARPLSAIIDAVTGIVLAAVAVIKLVYDIIKDKQQESNRRSSSKD